MEERLRYILSKVDDWLRFAEAKNVALLAANGATVIGALRLADGKEFLFDWIGYYFYFAVGLGALSGVVCLLSFLPQVQIPPLSTDSLAGKEADLFFFGHIAGYDPDSYVRALYAQQGTEQRKVEPFERDLAEQVIENSRIALRKYELFTVALWLDVAALLTPIGCFILYAVTSEQEV